jgi:hypothetical protein
VSVTSGATRSEDVWEDAYRHSLDIDAARASQYLLSTLGPSITATALGMSDARQLRAWGNGRTAPRELHVQGRLQLLYRISYAVATAYGPATAALFLRSASPRLGEQAPIALLRDHDPDEVQTQLLAATRSFVEGTAAIPSADEAAATTRWSAPVEVPDDLSALRGPTTGIVQLPLSVYSSGAGPDRQFNLDDERERIALYEIVLTNGTAAQISRFLNVNELLRLWPKLWLPPHVHRAWGDRIPIAAYIAP